MTIAEVLGRVDRLRPNRFDRALKVEWLREIERQLWLDVVCTHESAEGIREPAFDINSDPETVLIAPTPYDEVYQAYLLCRIDLGNMETAKYNNDRVLFNNALMSFRDYWNRTHLPKTGAGGWKV